MRFKLFLIGASLLGTLESTAQRPDSVTRYIDSAIQVFKEHSLYAATVNWKQVQDSVDLLSQTATTYKQADASIIWAFSQLKDKHGFVATNDSFYRYSDGETRVLSKGILAEYKKPRSIKVEVLANKVGYYKMPSVQIGSNTAKMKEWANNLSDSLCKLLALQPRSLIIDLRMNNGGNSAPMFEALKPLLGKSYTTYGANSQFKILKKESDSATLAYQQHAIPDRLCAPTNPSMRIAVLIGPGTASSGEILAMALSSRSNTRLFGEKTIGVCNATNGFLLTTNAFYCLLVENYVADYKQKINKAQIVVPDVYVKSDNDNYTSPADDPTVQAALQWLSKKK
ncbi:S41 family peptidase [Flavisolibacter tropicus]|uniref:Tail specific protease domain-containing protein n=1 Tax=Flavisolibacter tropicus TaxID=1492898 RepID=A0A172TYL9_9BACT|nr:S41 family peptidase [Flavisolibacter tropicus]ANE51837.1 hypothetical protein SY85_16410 [Flavisolibacter tropicus]